MSEEKINFRDAWRYDWRGYKIIWQQSPRLLVSTALTAIAQGLFPYVPIYFTAQIINELASAHRPQKLAQLVLTTIISIAITTLLTAIFQHWQNAEQETLYYWQDKLFGDKLMSMDFDAIDAKETGDKLAQIDQARNFAWWGLQKLWADFGPLLQGLMAIVGALALSVTLFTSHIPQASFRFLNSPWLLLGLVLIMLVILFLSPYCAAKADAVWASHADWSIMGNRLFRFWYFVIRDKKRSLDVRIYQQEAFRESKIKQITAFTAGGEFSQLTKGKIGLLKALSGILSQVFIGVIYLYVCLKALGGAFEIGSVTQYIAAITAFFAGLSTLLTTVGDFQNNAPFMKQIFDFLDRLNEMYQGSLTIEKRSDKKYEIEFRDVSFKYPGTEEFALRHISLRFAIGERLAVVGMNGSGKTTFIKLLCRLYDPTEGEILLNGINIRKYDYQEYMSIFSVVFQDFKLLAFRLGENIATSVTVERARAHDCLVQAGFDEALEKLPKGLDSILYKDFDEQGIDVSGGEAQKIALARALYKEAAFIILDEPTAALDPIAEFDVYQRMNQIVGNKTAVFISHRLSSCRFCQNIAVFDEGKVIQRGSHEELLADVTGKYHELWQAQAQYYTE